LFSGIGGFALAAQAVGYTTVGFSEIDPFACRVLKRHWPDVPNYGNIRSVRNVRADLVTGGFPCQPFSVAGKRGGAADDRHLWPQMLRVIRQARPAWVLGENVPGFITMELDNTLADLETLGYACRPLVIPACAVDARHRRDRVWIIAKRIVDHPHHAGSEQRLRTYPDRQEEEFGWQGQPQLELGTASEVVAHAHDTGRQAAEGLCEGRGSFHQWPAEPRVGRMAYGISHRTHRLRGLGNAIVPQVAEAILRAMTETETNP
jgi:DNA (cytosine-5)-methyltransferase 1